MAERPLDSHHVAASRDQSRRVEVPQVVQPVLHPCRVSRLAPEITDRVLMKRVFTLSWEEPPVHVVSRPEYPHMLTDRFDQLIGRVDDALTPVLRRADLDLLAVSPLHLL